MTRTPLPNRRHCETLRFDHGGIRYFATYGRPVTVSNGRPVIGPVAEVFLQGGKAGSAIESVARDSAVAVSLALQFGVPLQVIQHSITRLDDGSAAGPMGAALDAIVRALADDGPDLDPAPVEPAGPSTPPTPAADVLKLPEHVA